MSTYISLVEFQFDASPERSALMFFASDSPCQVANRMNSDRPGGEEIPSRIHTRAHAAKWSVDCVTANHVYQLHV